MLVEKSLEVGILEVGERAIGKLEDAFRQVLNEDVSAVLAFRAELVLGRVGVECVECVAAIKLTLKSL